MAKKLQRSVRPKRSAAAPSEGGAPRRAPKQRRLRSVSEQAVNDFTVQLATLSSAGIPIVRALTILERQIRPGPFKNVVGELVEDVSAGTPLSEAMAKHPRVFDDLYSSMVRAGEAGGLLDSILQRLAKYRERASEIRGKVVGAIIYPAVIVCVAIAVVTAVIVFVIPKFRQIFDSFDVPLPAVTQLLLNLSDFAVAYWYIVFGVPVLLFFLHGFLMRRGGAYRFRMHGLMLKLPLLGNILSQSLIASFSRTFGTLLEAGVPHLDALEIVRDTSSNDVLADGVESIRRTVREGEGISHPMEETGVFDDLVCNMVDVGEQTGELDQMLIRVADAYEAQVDRRIDAMFKVLEPLLLILIAIFVGFIVIALFMPLMKIMSTLNQP
ncbi:MAG TPA: type II secretion system F family protein [Planctomycetes bacterium]|nr:type II secretion system F family protein [Planctomycetota bacterium]